MLLVRQNSGHHGENFVNLTGTMCAHLLHFAHHDNKAKELLNLIGCCLHLYLTKHDTCIFVVKTQSLEEIIHPFIKIGSLECYHHHSWNTGVPVVSLPITARGKMRGRTAFRLRCHSLERERNLGEVSLFQQRCFIRNGHILRKRSLIYSQHRPETS